MEKVDTVALAKVVNDCFDFSIDGRLTDDQQDEFRLKGRHLRGNLIVMLSRQFDDGTQALTDANAKLTQVNEELSDEVAVLEKTADTLNNLAALASSLDKLLTAASSAF